MVTKAEKKARAAADRADDAAEDAAEDAAADKAAEVVPVVAAAPAIPAPPVAPEKPKKEERIAALEAELAALRVPEPVPYPKWIATEQGPVVVDSAEQEAAVLSGEVKLEEIRSADGVSLKVKVVR